MKRYHSEYDLLRERQMFYAQIVLGEGCTVNTKSGGYFRKRKVLDCGRRACRLCHRGKVDRLFSLAEKRANERLKDELADLAIFDLR